MNCGQITGSSYEPLGKHCEVEPLLLRTGLDVLCKAAMATHRRGQKWDTIELTHSTRRWLLTNPFKFSHLKGAIKKLQ